MKIKLTVLIVIILLLFSVNGCTSTNNNTEILREETQNNEIHQESPNNSEQALQSIQGNSLNLNSLNKTENQYVVTDSDKVIGWKKLTAKVFLYEMIYNKGGRSWNKLEGDRTVEYSIHFPSSWTLKGSVFEDANNNKIAELFPVTLLENESELAFLDYKPDEENGEKQLAKESIFLNKYKGTKTILKVDTESIMWYPHIYLLSDGTYGFGMVLYSCSEKRNEVEVKLFNDIINTLKFDL